VVAQFWRTARSLAWDEAYEASDAPDQGHYVTDEASYTADEGRDGAYRAPYAPDQGRYV